MVGVGADRVAEVVEAGAAQHRVQIDHAEHPPLAVEEDVVDLRVVVRHAARDLARFDPLPEAEHLVAAAFDPFDFACHRRTASRGVAREGIVPLSEAGTDVVEAGQNVGQRFAVVGQHPLEAADAFAAARTQLAAFAAGRDYAAWLVKSAAALAETMGESGTLYARTADLPLLQGKLPAGVALAADDTITLGGLRAANPATGLAADDTLEARLDAQHDWFLQNAGLEITI